MASEITVASKSEIEAMRRLDDGPSEIESMIRLALDKGLNPTELYSILAQERATRAAAEFNRALADFQASCPPVPKTDSVGFVGKVSKVGVAYNYAKLETITKHIQPYLDSVGLSCTFDTEPCEQPGMLVGICIVRHVGGHCERTRLPMPVASMLTTASPSQKVEGTMTSLKRATLRMALGLSTIDPDPDEPASDGATITAEQAARLEKLLAEVGANIPKFLEILKVEKVSDLSAESWPKALAMIEAKRMQNEKTKGSKP